MQDQKQMLYTLRRVLKEYHISESRYSIMKPKEEAVCIDYVNGTWRVFVYENGECLYGRTFSSPKMACCNLLKRVSCSNYAAETLKSEFLSMLI